eukprot:gene10169-31215_t
MALFRRAAASLLPRLQRFQSTAAAPLATFQPVDAALTEPYKRTGGSMYELSMGKAPVNSLSLEMLESMVAGLDEAENTKGCRGLLITSSRPGIFSAGLDIEEMYKPDPERLHKFWFTLQELFLRLSQTRLATVAAIEGHSPAGGCLLGIASDYRVMSQGTAGKEFTIGLNETKLGIVAPFWFCDTFKLILGDRQADFMLQTGALVTADEAISVGLVDQAVPHDEVKPQAVKMLHTFLSVPDMA